jgi:hypothetical protein
MRQLPYVLTTDGSADLVYAVWSGKFCSILSPQPASTVSASSFTEVDFSTAVPKLSTLANVGLKLYNNAGGSNDLILSPTSSGTYSSTYLSNGANGTFFTSTSTALNTTNQKLYVKLTSASGSSSSITTLTGYYITISV